MDRRRSCACSAACQTAGACRQRRACTPSHAASTVQRQHRVRDHAGRDVFGFDSGLEWRTSVVEDAQLDLVDEDARPGRGTRRAARTGWSPRPPPPKGASNGQPVRLCVQVGSQGGVRTHSRRCRGWGEHADHAKSSSKAMRARACMHGQRAALHECMHQTFQSAGVELDIPRRPRQTSRHEHCTSRQRPPCNPTCTRSRDGEKGNSRHGAAPGSPLHTPVY